MVKTCHPIEEDLSGTCPTSHRWIRPADYTLAACYWPRTAAQHRLRPSSSMLSQQPGSLGAASSVVGSGASTPTASDFERWWADGEDPTYYVVSPKACMACQISLQGCHHSSGSPGGHVQAGCSGCSNQELLFEACLGANDRGGAACHRDCSH